MHTWNQAGGNVKLMFNSFVQSILLIVSDEL